MSVIVTELTKELSSQALALVCDEFSVHSPLHRALDIAGIEYLAYLSPQWRNYAFGDQSIALMALNVTTNELIGCLIAIPYDSQLVHFDKTPTRLRPITALLRQLEQDYERLRSRQSAGALLVDIAVVKDDLKGNGYYKQLRSAVQQKAREAGFGCVLGELSSVVTQHVCVQKMGHKVLAEIKYADFMFEGAYPFAVIEEPASIQLVGCSLI